MDIYENKLYIYIYNLQQVLKVFFLHSPWQIMQNIETMFPLHRVKLCWFGHQGIRMEW